MSQKLNTGLSVPVQDSGYSYYLILKRSESEGCSSFSAKTFLRCCVRQYALESDGGQAPSDPLPLLLPLFGFPVHFPPVTGFRIPHEVYYFQSDGGNRGQPGQAGEKSLSNAAGKEEKKESAGTEISPVTEMSIFIIAFIAYFNFSEFLIVKENLRL